MRPPVFSPQELIALAEIDAEIEKTFVITREEIEAARQRDRDTVPENKRAAWKRAYYQKHKAEDNAKSQAWRAAHPERVKTCNREYYAKHKEELREQSRRWYAQNKNEYNARRREKWRKTNEQNNQRRDHRRNLTHDGAGVSRPRGDGAAGNAAAGVL